MGRSLTALGGALSFGPVVALSSIALCLGGACDPLGLVQDPMRRDAIAALGPEAADVPRGPRHRAGQPCGLCHSEDGDEEPFLFAGTVFRDPGSKLAVADVEVRFVDSTGKTFTTKTNCVGNFFVKPRELRASGPVWVSVQLNDLPYEMESPIHREISCAACHLDPAGPASEGHVYLTDDETMFDSIPSRACGPADEDKR